MSAAHQRGYALLELALALLIASLLAAWGVQTLVNRYDDAEAQAAAVWMDAVHKAVIGYIRRYGPDIQMAGQPEALVLEGFADWQSPALPELVRAGLLSPGMPQHTRLTGAARITVWRQGDCPGNFCAVEALVHGERPLRQRRSNEPDEAMMAQWLLAAQGKGGAVQAGDPSRLRGTAFAYESRLPDGSVLPVGTVGMAVTAEQLAMWSYLRVRDPRDPDFQGGLTVAGSVQSGGDADVGGQLVLGAMRKDGEFCHPENAVAGEADGGLLVCRENRWRSPSRSGSGGYGYHSMHGCQTQEGASTANPVTGDCSCPWYSVAVRIMETGNIFPDGMQYAYLCVG